VPEPEPIPEPTPEPPIVVEEPPTVEPEPPVVVEPPVAVEEPPAPAEEPPMPVEKPPVAPEEPPMVEPEPPVELEPPVEVDPPAEEPPAVEPEPAEPPPTEPEVVQPPEEKPAPPVVAPEPSVEVAPEPKVEPIPVKEVTAETWVAPVAPETYLSKEEIKTYEEIGIVPNNPQQLPTDVPKLPDPVELKPHIQEDVKGVENGGIEFFGTQSAPQVIGEDGKLTPPAPEPGSGDPIPADAITTEETFIGQPGGTTFNAPDIAVPVDLIEINIDIPGVSEMAQGVADAYVAMANIGNDMSPVTRKKAKKILLTTIIVGQIISMRRM